MTRLFNQRSLDYDKALSFSLGKVILRVILLLKQLFKGIFVAGQSLATKIPSHPRPLGRILSQRKPEVHYIKRMMKPRA